MNDFLIDLALYHAACLEGSDSETLVAKALELLDESDEALAREIAEVRAKVQEGIDQLKSGNYTEYDEEGLQELRERIKRQGLERLAARDAAPL